jgi:hypothetical protein
MKFSSPPSPHHECNRQNKLFATGGWGGNPLYSQTCIQMSLLWILISATSFRVGRCSERVAPEEEVRFLTGHICQLCTTAALQMCRTCCFRISTFLSAWVETETQVYPRFLCRIIILVILFRIITLESLKNGLQKCMSGVEMRYERLLHFDVVRFSLYNCSETMIS